MLPAKLKYLQRYRDRHGKTRQYFRRPGFDRVALPGEPGSKTFMAAYEAALNGAPRAPKSNAKPGSITAMLIAYYQSSAWAELKPKTQATYRAILDRFRMQYGDLPADALTSTHVRKMIDAGAAKPGATRTLMKRLRGAYAFAQSRDLVPHNPFVGVRLPREGRGFRPWSDQDIQRFLDYWSEGSRARLALLLLLHTGQRRSDVVRMSSADLCDGVLTITQAKGRKGLPECTLVLPLHPDLVRALKDVPDDAPSFLITAYGKPMSASGFSGWFADCASKAGLPPGSSPHGLRKAAARRLAEAGCSAHQIAAVTGHKSLREVERYTQSAQQRHLAHEAMIKLWSANAPAV
jgi:integrase